MHLNNKENNIISRHLIAARSGEIWENIIYMEYQCHRKYIYIITV